MNRTPFTPNARNAPDAGNAPNAPNGKSGKYRQRPDMNGIELFTEVPQGPRKKPRTEYIVPPDGITLNFNDIDSDSDSDIDNFVWNPDHEKNVEDGKFNPENWKEI
jgi:hypothetical protein